MPQTETIIIAGVVGLAALLILSKSKAATQQAQLEQQLLSQPTPSSGLGSILSGIGSSIASGGLGSLTSAFSDTGSSNEPGFITGGADSNSPGLVDGGDDSDDDGSDDYYD